MKNWRTSFLSEYFHGEEFSARPELASGSRRPVEVHPLPELNGGDELYDLKKDPYEMQNMVHDSPAVLEKKKTARQIQRANQVVSVPQPLG